mmetsp:Transcript_15690/g.44995  ORF Transcript_15690/g.44995 Transcript_15690/m.44995 type:complete len:106 (+) Transcript_15690:88-405(+)
MRLMFLVQLDKFGLLGRALTRQDSSVLGDWSASKSAYSIFTSMHSVSARLRIGLIGRFNTPQLPPRLPWETGARRPFSAAWHGGHGIACFRFAAGITTEKRPFPA